MRRLSSLAFLLGLIHLRRALEHGGPARHLASFRNRQSLLGRRGFSFSSSPKSSSRASEFHDLARSFGSHLSVKDSIWIYLAGQPLSAVTPAKLGDIVRVVGIGRWGNLRTHSAFAVHTADKVYDLLALVLLASTGLITLIARHENQDPAVAALTGHRLGRPHHGAFPQPPMDEELHQAPALDPGPPKAGGKTQAHGREFYKDLLSLFQPTGKMILPFAYSLAAWIGGPGAGLFLRSGLGIPLSFTQSPCFCPWSL